MSFPDNKSPARRSKTEILFVCTGNICRSPTAEGVLRKMVEEAGLANSVLIESAGTQSFHVGESPDIRAQVAARKRGYDLSTLRARRVVPEDFERFDFVLAMDKGHLRFLKALCPKGYSGHLGLFLDFAPELGLSEVPDPYYGGSHGFERVLDLIEHASRSLLEQLQRSR